MDDKSSTSSSATQNDDMQGKNEKDNPLETQNNGIPTKTDDDTIPSDILELKERLERETGKKYKYRPANKDLPPVSHLLRYGVPGQERKGPTSWKETVGGPILLAAVFGLSLLIFHYTVLSHPSNRVPYTLKKRMTQEQYEEALKLQQQQPQHQPQKHKSRPLDFATKDLDDEF
jgi:hypothetical protein